MGHPSAWSSEPDAHAPPAMSAACADLQALTAERARGTAMPPQGASPRPA